MKIFFSVLLFILTSVLFSQSPNIQWQNTYGGSSNDVGRYIREASDGGFIIVGGTESTDGDIDLQHGYVDLWIVKTDMYGSIEWNNSIGGTSIDEATCIEPTSDGGYILAGYTYSDDGDVASNHGSIDVWVVKVNSMGSLVWEKTFGGSDIERAYSVKPTPDGGYYIYAYTESIDGDLTSFNHGQYDLWVIKLFSNGDMQWQKTYGGPGDDKYSIGSLQVTSDGGFIIAGDTDSMGGDVNDTLHGGIDAWIIKADSLGNIQWQNLLGGSQDETILDVQLTIDGGYILCGWTKSNDGDASGLHGSNDLWLVKIDIGGIIQWQYCYGGSNSDLGSNIIPLSNGGFICTGYTKSNNGDVSGYHDSGDIWVTRIDSSGSLQWQKCIGGSQDDYSRSMIQTMDGSFVLGGYTSSGDGDMTGTHGQIDFLILKLDPENLEMEEEKPFSFTVYPNPTSDVFTISGLTQESTLTILDLHGKTVLSQTMPMNNSTIDISSLSPGIYFVNVSSGKEKIKTYKLVVR